MRHCVKEVDSLFHPKVRWGEDSIFNAAACISGKPRLACGIKGIYRFHQSNGADGNKILLIARQGVIFFTICATSRRLWRISFSRAAASPACRALKAAASSRAVSGRGKQPLSRWSARNRNFVAKNCSKVSSTRYPSRYIVVRLYEPGRG